MKSDVSRNLGNFARVPLWNCIFNKDEIEQLLDTCGDWIFCNGHIREFVINKLTDNRFKVSTKAKTYA